MMMFAGEFDVYLLGSLHLIINSRLMKNGGCKLFSNDHIINHLGQDVN